MTLLPASPECRACPLWENIQSPGVPSRLFTPTINADSPAVIFLGQNPGFHEDASNTCFVGRSGAMVERLARTLLDFAPATTIYFANTARCFTPSDRPPSIKNCRTCFSTHSSRDILSIASTHTRTAILCLGGPASTTTWSHFSTQKKAPSFHDLRQRQNTLISPTPPLWFFSTFHPAAVLRDPPLQYPMAEHVQLVVLWLQSSLPTRTIPRIIPTRAPSP